MTENQYCFYIYSIYLFLIRKVDRKIHERFLILKIIHDFRFNIVRGRNRLRNRSSVSRITKNCLETYYFRYIFDILLHNSYKNKFLHVFFPSCYIKKFYDIFKIFDQFLEGVNN